MDNIQNYVENVIEFFSGGNGNVDTNAYKTGKITKKAYLESVEKYIRGMNVSSERQQQILQRYIDFVWGYDVLKPLIEADDITDIHCLAFDNIRVKQIVGRKTIRTNSGIRFDSQKHMKSFIESLVIRNKVNLSAKDAMPFFMDKESSPVFRLRCNIITHFLTCEETPFLYIRKEPKKKKTLIDLLAEGMIPAELMSVCQRAAQGPMIVVGESGSGKTAFMNAELEEVSMEKNILILQEMDELFSDRHPDTLSVHTVPKKGDGVEYTFHDLAKTAMLLDRDFLVFTEVKGKEAADVFTAALTGHNPWISLHAADNRSAAYQLGNYIHMATNYELEDVFRMLSFVRFTLFHLTDYTVDEVTEMCGWDSEKEEIIFRDVWKKGEHLWR